MLTHHSPWMRSSVSFRSLCMKLIPSESAFIETFEPSTATATLSLVPTRDRVNAYDSSNAAISVVFFFLQPEEDVVSFSPFWRDAWMHAKLHARPRRAIVQ